MQMLYLSPAYIGQQRLLLFTILIILKVNNVSICKPSLNLTNFIIGICFFLAKFCPLVFLIFFPLTPCILSSGCSPCSWPSPPPTHDLHVPLAYSSFPLFPSISSPLLTFSLHSVTISPPNALPLLQPPIPSLPHILPLSYPFFPLGLPSLPSSILSPFSLNPRSRENHSLTPLHPQPFCLSPKQMVIVCIGAHYGFMALGCCAETPSVTLFIKM